MRHQLALALIAICLVALKGCSGEVHRQKYEVTIEVEVDGELKTASSVLEYRFTYLYGPEVRYGRWFAGVAPVLHVGRHGDLVLSLMSYGHVEYKRGRINGQRCFGSGPGGWPLWANVPGYEDMMKSTEPFYILKRKDRARAKAELPVKRWPKFMWRPPGATSETEFKFMSACDLQFEFGDAVKLKRITLQPTDKPMVTRIADAPQWIEDWRAEIADVIAAGRYGYGRHVGLRTIEMERLQ